MNETGLLAVYDWDSLSYVSEVIAVGQAAATWSAVDGSRVAPPANEIAAYVASYEDAAVGRFGRTSAWRSAPPPSTCSLTPLGVSMRSTRIRPTPPSTTPPCRRTQCTSLTAISNGPELTVDSTSPTAGCALWDSSPAQLCAWSARSFRNRGIRPAPKS